MSEKTSASSSTTSSTETTLPGSESSPVRDKSPPRPYILDTLRCPQRTELTRKRKIVSNPARPSAKRRSSSGRGTFDHQSVTPSQRVSEFPAENSVCPRESNACREEIAINIIVIIIIIDG